MTDYLIVAAVNHCLTANPPVQVNSFLTVSLEEFDAANMLLFWGPTGSEGLVSSVQPVLIFQQWRLPRLSWRSGTGCRLWGFWWVADKAAPVFMQAGRRVNTSCDDVTTLDPPLQTTAPWMHDEAPLSTHFHNWLEASVILQRNVCSSFFVGHIVVCRKKRDYSIWLQVAEFVFLKTICTNCKTRLIICVPSFLKSRFSWNVLTPLLLRTV